MKIYRLTLIGAFCLFLSVNNGPAQDMHYWNLQYGTRSILLGGAVIGSVSDMAATYYNPAALALFPKQEILLSGKVYQYSSLTLRDGAGEGKDLKFSNIEAAPSIFAGSFTFDWLGENILSYSVLTRQYMDMEIEGRRGGSREDNPNELAAGELISRQKLSDLWIGLSWSRKITDILSVGVTPYLSVRDQKTRKHVYSEVLAENGDVSAGIITQQYTFKVYSLLAKFGIGARLGPLTLGITATTPYLNIGGSGSSLLNLVNTGAAADSQRAYIVNNQLDVEAVYHNPFSVGVGFGYRMGRNRLHASAEWFAAVPQYRILETKDFVGHADGKIYRNIVNTEAKSVLNYGIGAEIYLKEKLWLFASYVTDFSASVPDSKTNVGVATWDINHLSAGVLFSIGRSDINIGLNYSFGQNKLRGPVNLPEGQLKNALLDLLSKSEVDYRRLQFLVGFSFELN